jgi:hypothetical protein
VTLLRGQVGETVRTGAAILFPSFVVLNDHYPELAILLYLAETGMSSMVLLARTLASLHTTRRALAAGVAGVRDRHVSQLLKARELTTWTVVVAVAVLPLLTMGVLATREGEWGPRLDLLADRTKWMALVVLASAVLDSLIAPVRSMTWLQSSVGAQLTRLIVLHPTVMVGFALYSVTKSTLGLVGIFVTLRLILDLWHWRTASRVYVRRRSFGRLAEEEAPARPQRRVAG